jgi:DEAD/DEAH box helicase domain-containing protein
MDSLIEDEKATAIYIYPAKALSNDQLHVLKDL